MAAVVSGEGLGLFNTQLAGSAGNTQTGQAGGSVYVNTSTGNLVIQNQDQVLIGQGLDNVLVRTYNSLGQLTDDNGDNFRFSFNERLINLTGTVNTVGSTITRVNGDGHESLYTYDATSGQYISADGAGAHDTLDYDATLNAWTWEEGSSGIREVYEWLGTEGRLYATVDINNRATGYAYAGNGFVSTITDNQAYDAAASTLAGSLTASTDSQTIYVDYVAGTNNVEKIRTNSAGIAQTLVYYAYDGLNRLTEVKIDLSPEDQSTTDNNVYVTTYTYDGTSARIASVTQTDGTTLSFTYYDASQNYRIKTVTTGTGDDAQQTLYIYTQTTDIQRTDIVQIENAATGEGPTTSYLYDAQDRLVQTISPADANGQRHVTTYVYDEDGRSDDNLTSVINANGYKTIYLYDDNGNQIEQQDALGNTVRRVFNGENQLISETSFIVPDSDAQGTEQPAEARTSYYAYDAQGRVRFIIDAEGSVVENRYDDTNPAAQLISTITYVADSYDVSTLTSQSGVSLLTMETWASTADLTKIQRTDSQLDFRGQVASVTNFATTDVSGIGQLNGQESTTHFIYDQAGNLIKTVEARGATPLEDSSDAPSTVAHDTNNYENLFVYDGLNRLLASTDAAGYVTTTVYDDANGKISTAQPATSAGTLQTTRAYNSAGELISVTESSGGTDLSAIQYYYDSLGRLRATQDATGVLTHTLYDDLGRVLATVDGTGAVSEFLYDGIGNIIRTTEYSTRLTSAQFASLSDDIVAGTAELPPVLSTLVVPSDEDRITYNIYDEAGRLSFAFDQAGYVTEYQYDGAGQLVKTIEHTSPIPGFNSLDTAGFSITNQDIVIDVTQPIQPYLVIDGARLDEPYVASATVSVDSTASTVAPTQNPFSSSSYVEDAINAVFTTTVATVEGDNATVLDSAGVIYSGGDVYLSSSVVPNEVSGTDYRIANVYQSDGTLLHTLTAGTGSLIVSSQLLASGNYGVVVEDWRASEPDGEGGYTDPEQLHVHTEFGFTIGTGDLPTVLSWPISEQPAGTTVSFQYAPTGTNNYTTATVVTNGPNHEVSLPITIEDESYYDFIIQYVDANENLLKFTQGTDLALVGVSVDMTFEQWDVSNSPETGSSLTGYIELSQVGDLFTPQANNIDYVSVTVTDLSGVVIQSDVRTYPEVILAATGVYDGRINLSIGSVLADGQYNLQVSKNFHDGSTQLSTVGLVISAGVGSVVQTAYAADAIDAVFSSNTATLQANNATTFDSTGVIYSGGKTYLSSSVIPNEVSNTDYRKAKVYKDGVHQYTLTAGLSNLLVSNSILSEGSYSVIIEDWRDAEPDGEGGYTDPEKIHTHSSVVFTIGSGDLPTIFSWPISEQPTGTTISFQYALAGSGSYNSATVSTNGSNHEVSLSLSNGNYDYIIQYLDTGGNLFKVKTSTGTITSTLGQNNSVQANFERWDMTSSPTTGSSVTGLIDSLEVGDWFAPNVTDLEYVSVVVKDLQGNIIENDVRTYPDLILAMTGAYDGRVNLSIGSELGDGQYNIELSKHYYDSSVSGPVSYYYEIGQQHRQTVSWPEATHMLVAGDVIEFQYRLAGSSDAYATAEVAYVAGTDPSAVLKNLDNTNYEFIVTYKDQYNRVLKEFNGVTSAQTTEQLNIDFEYNDVRSTATTGTSIDYFDLNTTGITEIDYVLAQVRDTATSTIVSTVKTYPEFQLGYSGQAYDGAINLSVGAPLADGQYEVTVSIFNKDGTSTQQPTFIYEIGEQPVLERHKQLSIDVAGFPNNGTVVYSYQAQGSTDSYDIELDPANQTGQILHYREPVQSYQYDELAHVDEIVVSTDTLAINNSYTLDNQIHSQTLSWSADLFTTLAAADSIAFTYRPAGTTNEQTVVVELIGNQYQVVLNDLVLGDDYEFRIQYLDLNGQLIEWTDAAPEGQAEIWHSLTVGDTNTLDTQIKYKELVTDVSFEGSSLTNYVDLNIVDDIDYLIARVYEQGTSNLISEAYTYPVIETNYTGRLNLSTDTILADGIYSVEVEIIYKDARQDDVGYVETAHELNFDYEVGRQLVEIYNDVTVVSDANGVTISRGDLGIPGATYSGLTVNLDTTDPNNIIASNSVDLTGLAQGTYEFSYQIKDSIGEIVDYRSGLFSVFAGDAPGIDDLQAYYQEKTITPVQVEISEETILREADNSAYVDYLYSTATSGVGELEVENKLTLTAENTLTQNTSGLYYDAKNNLTKLNIDDIRSLWGGTSNHLGSFVVRVYHNDQLYKAVSKTKILNLSKGSYGTATSLLGKNDSMQATALVSTAYAAKNGHIIVGRKMPPGDYRVEVSYLNLNFDTPNPNLSVPSDHHIFGFYGIGGFSEGQSAEFNVSVGGLSDTSKVSWDAQTDLGIATFYYKKAGAAEYETANVVRGDANTQSYAQLRNGLAAGQYEYRIEYSNNGELSSWSEGSFEISKGAVTNMDNAITRKHYFTTTGNGSALVSSAPEHAAVSNIASLDVVVKLAGTSTIVSTLTTTIPTGVDFDGRINLSNTVLADGQYDIEITTHYRDGQTSTIATLTGYEVGVQNVGVEYHTEVRWNAVNRPENTDVYFRYKAVADDEFDPQHYWIPAIARLDIGTEGEQWYSVGFPQYTPDGERLEPLTAGDYDYMVVYVDQETGSEVETALGGFTVVESASLVSEELTFHREVDARATRHFYDDAGRMIAQLNAEGYMTGFRYDDAGQLIETIAYARQIDENLWAAGTLAQLQPTASADDIHTFNIYDHKGQLTGVVDGEGYLNETVYDVAGQVIQSTRYANSVDSLVLSQLSNGDILMIENVRPTLNALDQTITNTYDVRGLLDSQTNSEGTLTNYDYDALGRLISTQTGFAVSGNGADDVRTTITEYDLQGRVVEVRSGEAAVDSLLNGVVNEYDVAGRIISSTDANGNKTLFYYDATGRVLFSINALGEIAETVYNTFGNAIETYNYAGALNTSLELPNFTGGLITTDVLNALRAKRSLTDTIVLNTYTQRGNLGSSTDALGNETSFVYNAFGELKFELNQFNGGGESYESRTVVTEHVYDRLGRQITRIGDISLGASTVTSSEYDAFGRITRRFDEKQQLIVENTYDKLGRAIVTTTDPADFAIGRTFAYDAFGRVLTQTDGLGNTSTYSYDENERSLTVTTAEGVQTKTIRNRHGEQVEIIDGNGNSTTFEYDLDGNVTRITDAENNDVTTTYDQNGLVTETIDANGNKTTFTYDVANRLTQQTVDPDGLNLTTQYRYDSKGQQIEQIDANGIITRTLYNEIGQVVSIIVDAVPLDANGNEAPIAGHDYQELMTSYAYDAQGRQVAVYQGGTGEIQTNSVTGQKTLDSLQTTYYEYDSLGRLVRTIVDPDVADPENENTLIVDGLDLVTQYEYDELGNMVKSTDAEGHATLYVYDQLSRLVFTINAVGEVTENFYDVQSQLVRVAQYGQRLSLQTLAAMMAEGGDAEFGLTVTHINDLLGAIEPDRRTQSVYDADGRLRYSVNTLGVVVENQYDGNGNIVLRLTYANALDASVEYLDVTQIENALVQSASQDQQVRTFYDANNRAVLTVDNTGFVAETIYTPNGEVARTVNYAVPVDTALTTEAGVRAALTTTAAYDRVVRYVYDTAGRQIFSINAEDFVTETQYDAVGRAISTIQYNEVVTLGDTPTETEVRAALGVVDANDRLDSVAYDGAGRMISATDAEGYSEYYNYDARGNRIHFINKAGNEWFYTYDKADRLVSETGPEVAITTLEAPVYQNDFTSGYGGLTGSLTTHFNVVDAQLLLNPLVTGVATPTTVALLGETIHNFNDNITFRTEINTGAYGQDNQDLALRIGAQNTATGSAQRFHRAYFADDKVYAEYYDANTDSVVTIELGDVSSDTDYIIEVATEEKVDVQFDANGDPMIVRNDVSVLYIYESGDARDSRYSHEVISSAWTDAQFNLSLEINENAVATEVAVLNIGELGPYAFAEMGLADDVLSVTATQSIITEFTHDALGNVIARTEAKGTHNERTTYYGYDELGRQVVTVNPEVGVYDFEIDSTTADPFRSDRVENFANTSSRVFYDVFGNAIAQTDVAGQFSFKVYDELNQLRYEIDAEGYVTELQYDAFGNQTSLTRYATAIVIDSHLDATTGAVILPFQGPGVTEVQALLQVGAQDRTLTNEYDALNRVVRVIQPQAYESGIDSNGDLVGAYTQAETVNVYDAFGQLVKQSHLQQSSSVVGQDIWVDNYNYYDRLGRVQAQVNAEGYVTEFEYDDVGNLISQTEYAIPLDLTNASVLTALDGVAADVLAQVVSNQPDLANPQPSSNPLGYDRITTFTYDKQGNQLSQTQVMAEYSVTDVSDPANVTVQRLFADLTTTNTYDALGNRTSVTDVSGATVYTYYDALGRTTGVVEASRSSEIVGATEATVLLLENAGNASATITWAKPLIAGVTAEVRFRAVGETNWQTPISATDTNGNFEVAVGSLPSDAYEYEITYYRLAGSQAYAVVTGNIDIATGNVGTGQAVSYAQLDSNNTLWLYIEGNTTGLTEIDIVGVSTQYTVANGKLVDLGNGRYKLDVSALDRGTYDFTTVGITAGNISSAFTHTHGALGGAFDIQTIDYQIKDLDIDSDDAFKWGPDPLDNNSEDVWLGENKLELDLSFLLYLDIVDVRYELTVKQQNELGGTRSNIKFERDYGDAFNAYDVASGQFTHIENRDTRALGVTSRDEVYFSRIGGTEPFDNPWVYKKLVGFNKLKLWVKLADGREILAVNTKGNTSAERLEFINLPSNANKATFEYRLVGSDSEYTAVNLKKISSGYFVMGAADIPLGEYEYRVITNGSHVAETGTQFLGKGSNDVSLYSVADGSESGSRLSHTPLTTFQHDAYGNVVSQYAHANGVVSADVDGFQANLADVDNDQITYTRFNAYGNQIQHIDAEGSSQFFSYDAYGNVAKEWRIVNDDQFGALDQSMTRTAGTVYRYDSLGNQIENIRLLDDEGTPILATTQMQYNAFGEMTARGLKEKGSGWQEYFDYDGVGNLLRTNQHGGVDTVYFYNLQGQVVSQLRSNTINLGQSGTYTTADIASLLALGGDVQRTINTLDKLGRLVNQAQPSYTQDGNVIVPEIQQTLDRWDNVISATDALGVETQLRYDHNNQVVEQIQAANVGVESVDEHGVSTTVNPTTDYYYDSRGNVIAVVDANGHIQARVYDEVGQLTDEIAADGGVVKHRHDLLGREVEVTNQLGFATLMQYDRNNRLVAEYLPGSLSTVPTRAYSYDELGNRLTMTQSLDDSGATETTRYDYDLQGNIIRSELSGGLAVEYAYDLQGNKIEEDRFPDSSSLDFYTATWEYDYFGRVIDHDDLGGADYDYVYDFAGNLTHISNSGAGTHGIDGKDIDYTYYSNGWQKTIDDNGTGAALVTFRYDAMGRKIQETGLADTLTSYDALGRITQVTSSSSALTQGTGVDQSKYDSSISYYYDSVGNRRRVVADSSLRDAVTTSLWDPFLGITTTTDHDAISISQDLWYTYDKANRIVISQGQLDSNNDIVHTGTSEGVLLTYDSAGNRLTSTDKNGKVVLYAYNGLNQITLSYIDGYQTSRREYDHMGRVTKYVEYTGSNPSTIKEVRTYKYNANNQVLWQKNSLDDGSGLGNAGQLLYEVRYDTGGNYDSAGNLVYYEVKHKDSGGSTTAHFGYTYSYLANDSFKTQKIWGDDLDQGGVNYLSGSTEYTYNSNGVAKRIDDLRDSDNDQVLTVDHNGQIVQKKRDGKYQNYFYSDGKAIGRVNIDAILNNAQSTTTTIGTNHYAVSYSVSTGSNRVDFDYNYTPVSDQYPNTAPGSYTVNAGETLEAVALAVFGDAGLWYLIADANGLDAQPDDVLTQGMILVIPNVITNTHNNSDTFKPYNPSAIIGNTTPSMPVAPPPSVSGGGSSSALMIIAVVVAAVVTYGVSTAYTAPTVLASATTTGATSSFAITATLTAGGGSAFAGAAIAAAAGNLASQAVLILGGAQDGFDFGAVAASALTAGLTQGIGGALSNAAPAAKAIVNNVVGQGVNVLAGRQEGFDWRSMAVAAIAAPINAKINESIAGTEFAQDPFGADLASGLATGATSELVRMAVYDDGKFNVGTVAGDAFGNALGNAWARNIEAKHSTANTVEMNTNAASKPAVGESSEATATQQTSIAHAAGAQDLGDMQSANARVIDTQGIKSETEKSGGAGSVGNTGEEALTRFDDLSLSLNTSDPFDSVSLFGGDSFGSDGVVIDPHLGVLNPRFDSDLTLSDVGNELWKGAKVVAGVASGLSIVAYEGTRDLLDLAGLSAASHIHDFSGGLLFKDERQEYAQIQRTIGSGITNFFSDVPAGLDRLGDGISNAFFNAMDTAADAYSQKEYYLSGVAFGNSIVGESALAFGTLGTSVAPSVFKQAGRLGNSTLDFLNSDIVFDNGALASFPGNVRIVPDNPKVLNSNFDELGNLTTDAQKLYQRPSGYRKGVREQVWENARSSDGNVYDPLTNQVIDPDLPWDMGHRSGFEFRKHQQSAAERNITRQQFLDEHNTPDHFRPELPSSNRSHKGEDLTDGYFGF